MAWLLISGSSLGLGGLDPDSDFLFKGMRPEESTEQIQACDLSFFATCFHLDLSLKGALLAPLDAALDETLAEPAETETGTQIRRAVSQITTSLQVGGTSQKHTEPSK